MRRISYFDAGTNKRLKFLTNNFALPALTITQIYKSRWQVELFFKWIKQHLRIKSFYGTSENAVKTQIWIAISVYVHVAIIRKRLGIDRSLYQILQILSITILEKQPICRPFTRLIPNSMNSKILTSWFYSTSNRTLVIRHIQHHTAQLADRLRSALDVGIAWVGARPGANSGAVGSCVP